jgi:hypothetical protein
LLKFCFEHPEFSAKNSIRRGGLSVMLWVCFVWARVNAQRPRMDWCDFDERAAGEISIYGDDHTVVGALLCSLRFDFASLFAATQ